MANNNEQFQPLPELELIRASEVQPKEIDWLWYPFIPYGKVTLLQGRGLPVATFDHCKAVKSADRADR